jgi:hypothetical protein
LPQGVGHVLNALKALLNRRPRVHPFFLQIAPVFLIVF